MELKNTIETLTDMNILLTKLTAHISPESLENLYLKYKTLLGDFVSTNNHASLSMVHVEETKIQAYISERNYTDAKLLFGTIIAGVLVEMQTLAASV